MSDGFSLPGAAGWGRGVQPLQAPLPQALEGSLVNERVLTVDFSRLLHAWFGFVTGTLRGEADIALQPPKKGILATVVS